jgi:hypothetical protein
MHKKSLSLGLTQNANGRAGHSSRSILEQPELGIVAGVRRPDVHKKKPYWA